ncbi:MAG: hypothetical protein K8J31_02495 [Anaerolineae bacterium]|nr:hypothetical protein [Anaerolineae bacterium]
MMSRKARIILFSGILLIAVIAAVIVSAVLSPGPVERYDDIASSTAVLVATPVTSDSAEYTPCGWQWATQPNPNLSAEIQQRLADRLSGVQISEARAESYGENCLNADGSVRYFAAMQTDFRIIIRVEGLSAATSEPVQEILRPLADDVLAVLADYPPDDTPGPQPGMISLEFSAAAQESPSYRIWTRTDMAMQARNPQLSTSEFFNALGGLH